MWLVSDGGLEGKISSKIDVGVEELEYGDVLKRQRWNLGAKRTEMMFYSKYVWVTRTIIINLFWRIHFCITNYAFITEWNWKTMFIFISSLKKLIWNIWLCFSFVCVWNFISQYRSSLLCEHPGWLKSSISKWILNQTSSLEISYQTQTDLNNIQINYNWKILEILLSISKCEWSIYKLSAEMTFLTSGTIPLGSFHLIWIFILSEQYLRDPFVKCGIKLKISVPTHDS